MAEASARVAELLSVDGPFRRVWPAGCNRPGVRPRPRPRFRAALAL